MIGVDTNILVYAHRKDSAWHGPAQSKIKMLAQSPARWIIPWPCIHEFLAIVTHPRIYTPPTPMRIAMQQVHAWMKSPGMELVGESPRHWETLRLISEKAKISGPQIHDARIAAICMDHGVSELWSADRDYSRFASLHVVNPLTLP